MDNQKPALPTKEQIQIGLQFEMLQHQIQILTDTVVQKMAEINELKAKVTELTPAAPA